MIERGRQLRERDAAIAIGVSESCLRVWRHRGQGPPFFRFGRCVRYAEADIADFVAANRREPSHVKESQCVPGDYQHSHPEGK